MIRTFILVLAVTLVLTGCGQKVSVNLAADQLVLRQGVFSQAYDKPVNALTTVALISSTNLVFSGPCETVSVEKSTGLVPVPWGEELSMKDLPKFAFFSREPTTVGVLLSVSTNEVETVQQLLFIDTASDRRVQVECRNSASPRWIVGANGLPVGVQDLRWDAFGCKVSCIWEDPRMARCWRFEGQGKVRDLPMEQSLFEAAYAKVNLSPQDWTALRANQGTKMCWGLQNQLIDAAYYGGRLGKAQELKPLLRVLHPDIQMQLIPLLDNPDGQVPEVDGLKRVEDQIEWNRLRYQESVIHLRTMLQNGGDGVQVDFVSNYDFLNAPLKDLPWSFQKGVGTNGFWDYCDWIEQNHPEWSYLDFEYTGADVPEKRTYVSVDQESCRLRDGVFYGELVCTNGVMTARSTDFWGLSLRVVGFSDVNRDGVMDVVLFVNRRGGTANNARVCALSRSSATGRFYEVSQ